MILSTLSLSFRRWLAVLSLAVGIALSAFADSVEIDGLYYELNTTGRTATLTYQTTTTSNYASIPANLIVPSSVTYNGVSFSVTEISDRAFANCTKLESISIPASVTTIGTTAAWASNSQEGDYLPFYGCTSLKSIVFEDGTSDLTLSWHNYDATSISTRNRGMFYYCPLEEVYLGRNIKYKQNSRYTFEAYPQSYGYSAFYNQPKLTKVTIGETVTELPTYLFYNCEQLGSLEILTNALSTIPKYAFNGCDIKELSLPNSVRTIGESAFASNSNMTGANLGSSVETIGNSAFRSCNKLGDLELGKALISIGDYAFYEVGAALDDIQQVSLPGSLRTIGEYAFSQSHFPLFEVPNTVTTIGKYAFSSNTKLTSITLGAGCQVLPEGILSDCSALKDIRLQEGITTIPDRAFANCTKLESISIPASVTTIGTTAVWASNSQEGDYLPFYGCTSLKSIVFEDGTSDLTLSWHNYDATSISTRNRGMFYYCPLEEIYLGRNIKYKQNSRYTFEVYPHAYGYSAFYNQPKLTKITIGETVTEITPYLFYNNASITLMALPNVAKIGKAAFRGCSKLTTLNLGKSLTTIGDEAFYDCKNVTKLTLPNTTETIGASAFYNCSSVTEVTVGTGLRTIGANGFYGCKSFTALILPNEFTTMGESAFEGCTKLTVAKLGTSLTALPAKAFKDCTSLSEMVIPATAESIGDKALYNDSGLATITMNEGLKTIGNEVFWNNSGVMQFSIPGTVTSMGRNCFYGCTRATYLTFRDGKETLKIDNSGTRSSIIDAKTTNASYCDRKYDYFYDCPIRFLTLGRNLTYSYSAGIDIYDPEGTSFRQVNRASAPFFNSTQLRSVTIGPNVTFLYHHLFDGCANLATLRMGQSLETIYTYAFRNCDKLAKIEFPETLKLIDRYAFNHCDILVSTTFKESSTHTLSINHAAFKDCQALAGVTFPGQLNKLGNSAYSNCSILKDVVFNSNQSYKPILTIGDYTFEKCPLIQSLSFPGRLASIGNYTFRDCSYLADVSFEDSPDAVKLGYGATSTDGKYQQSSMPLFGNSNLQSLYLGRNIDYDATSSYGYSPFYNQQWLTDVRFSQAGTVTYCRDYLLYNVNNCETLQLPESITELGKYTFAGMTKLKGIFIPTKVAWLKEGLFADDVNIPEIIIHPAVTKIDSKVFANCKSLASATFEGSSDILEMGYGASQPEYGLFRDCPLETLNLDRWLSYNSEYPSRSPFYSIANLKNLTFGENVGVVDKYMFSYCTGLEEVYLPDNIESVGLWGFRGCSSLKKVRFSEKLSQVSDYGFSECTSLDNVVFPASMTSVADNSFSNCTSLKKLDLGKSLMIIGPAAFKNDAAIEGIELPETLYGLGVEAFANCQALPNVAIKAISSVGRQAFEGCTGLQWVSLSDKTTSLGENSFAGCTGIKYVKSYAEFPPEGLVNFVESVPADGTLFVPEYSLDYYQYSPTWENWMDIRPLNDNVMVSSVTLDKSEISFRATETEQLIAEVGAEDATDKGVLWRSADEAVATVDEAGVVTAVAIGETTVTALAADGSGTKAECHVIVNPTMVESITLHADATALKKGRRLEITATVLPATATDATYSWSSSDESLATVDAEGVVTAICAGNVEIVATANDGSNVTSKYALAIVPPTTGDSNDDDRVTVTDAVNTANYAVGNEVENFCHEAADINGDSRISIADASGTVAIVLDQPVEVAAISDRAKAVALGADNDMLTIDDFEIASGESATIAVRLDNTREYVAMQGDIALPDGLKIANITSGARTEQCHKVSFKRMDNGNVRFVIFDVNNNAFDNSDEAIINLSVKAEKSVAGDMSIVNILGSDASAHEYALAFDGGHNIGTTGIADVYVGNIRIEAGEGCIRVFNAVGEQIVIVAPDGKTAADLVAGSAEERCDVMPGIYVVTAGQAVKKVMVK